MKITFILKDLTEAFYEGGTYSIGLKRLNDFEKFLFLLYYARNNYFGITCKIGNGSFRDKVEFNQTMRKNYILSFSLEPRRGYKLATFIFS